jgi:2-dehydropantoate 2-reductase
MNIIVMGAGAIGSLFGALLAKKNTVILIGRKSHIDAIHKKGLIIDNNTTINMKIAAHESIEYISDSPDLLLLTVKSFDTRNAIHQAKNIIDNHTLVLSLQNGLDNLDMIKNIINANQILMGITNHGAFFSKPGLIRHTGKGKTIIGEINGKKTRRIKHIANIFSDAGIKTSISEDIFREVWIKTIINSSINPLTAIFKCKNGYLLKNPILERTVERICKESTTIAQAAGMDIAYEQTIQTTKDIIKNTAENYSSMVQSLHTGRKTEIESINKKIVEVGKTNLIDSPLNTLLVEGIETLSSK